MGDENFMIYGGVRLNKSEVSQTKTKTLQDASGKKEKVYIVNFKNGVKAAYRGAAPNTTFTPSITSNLSKTDYAQTDVYGVMGLELSGSKNKADRIEITNGSIIGVDVSHDGGGDSVKVHGSKADTRTTSFETGSYMAQGGIYTDKGDDTQIRQANRAEYTEKGTFVNEGIHRVNL